MAFISIEALVKRFGKVTAVDGVNLEIERGELVTLLGPSGCGKTTTLRCVAGLERPDQGDVKIDGRPMFSQGFVPPARRGIGMVFQNYAVWPHMTVFMNVAYGLRIQRVPKEEVRRRVREVLEQVGLGGLEGRYPWQLSGGQQQRVALARALVKRPKALLFDEPLSNLDAKLREKMRFEIKELVRQWRLTAVYVTHDQAEAMVISDRIAVMNLGKIVQLGAPEEIYRGPVTSFVADFIGAMNFIPGHVAGRTEGGIRITVGSEAVITGSSLTPGNLRENEPVLVAVRPEDIEVLKGQATGLENTLHGIVQHRAFLGNLCYLFINLGPTEVRVQVSPSLPFREGDMVTLRMDPGRCIVFSGKESSAQGEGESVTTKEAKVVAGD